MGLNDKPPRREILVAFICPFDFMQSHYTCGQIRGPIESGSHPSGIVCCSLFLPPMQKYEFFRSLVEPPDHLGPLRFGTRQ
jgi:hypothetical protein